MERISCPDYCFLLGRLALFASTWDFWLVKGMHESSPWWRTCLTCSWHWRQPVCELTTQPVSRRETLPRASQKSRDTASRLNIRMSVSLQASGFLQPSLLRQRHSPLGICFKAQKALCRRLQRNDEIFEPRAEITICIQNKDRKWPSLGAMGT